MKRIMSYHGYVIKQVTKTDAVPDYQIGEYRVVTRGGDEEYDAGSIKEAQEQIDGLIQDKIDERKAKLSGADRCRR